MTAKERSTYSDVHVRKVKFFERKYVPKVYKAIHSQILAFTDVLNKEGIDAAKRLLDKTVVNEQIAPVIQELYTVVGLYKARLVAREIKASARVEVKGFGLNLEWIQSLINYFREYGLNKVSVPITQTTRKQILDVLSEGEREGWTIDRMTRKLESSELTLWRAQLIARTEIAKAMFKGHQLASDKSTWETEDTWIATEDHRTRHSHRLVDGDVIGTGGRFKVPTFHRVGKVDIQTGFDLMEGPGDPRASIANLANCRCTKVSRARRDENGRLIRKSNRLMLQ
jgi:hypothetical protein